MVSFQGGGYSGNGSTDTLSGNGRASFSPRKNVAKLARREHTTSSAAGSLRVAALASAHFYTNYRSNDDG